jgi:hypothetical protein
MTQTQKKLRLILKHSSYPHIKSLNTMSYPARKRNLGNPTLLRNLLERKEGTCFGEEIVTKKELPGHQRAAQFHQITTQDSEKTELSAQPSTSITPQHSTPSSSTDSLSSTLSSSLQIPVIQTQA